LAAGFADDYALLIGGLLDLYEAGGGLRWLQWAVQLQETLDSLFWDPTGGYEMQFVGSAFLWHMFGCGHRSAQWLQGKVPWGRQPGTACLGHKRAGMCALLLDAEVGMRVGASGVL
jgi:hypothetical protein